MKLCFEELQHRPLNAKNLLPALYSFVTEFAYQSISAGYFCKDPRKLAIVSELLVVNEHASTLKNVEKS